MERARRRFGEMFNSLGIEAQIRVAQARGDAYQRQTFIDAVQNRKVSRLATKRKASVDTKLGAAVPEVFNRTYKVPKLYY